MVTGSTTCDWLGRFQPTGSVAIKAGSYTFWHGLIEVMWASRDAHVTNGGLPPCAGMLWIPLYVVPGQWSSRLWKLPDLPGSSEDSPAHGWERRLGTSSSLPATMLAGLSSHLLGRTAPITLVSLLGHVTSCDVMWDHVISYTVTTPIYDHSHECPVHVLSTFSPWCCHGFRHLEDSCCRRGSRLLFLDCCVPIRCCEDKNTGMSAPIHCNSQCF